MIENRGENNYRKMKKFKTIAKAVWQLVSYLFWPQQGKQRRKMELLKKDITYLIGKERAEGNLEPLTAEYISRVLKVPVEEVEECMKEMGII